MSDAHDGGSTPGKERLWPAILVVAAVVAVGVVRLLLTFGDPYSAYGDNALLELATRNALDGDQLLGPYSRFGWNHPGPAFFYLTAPFQLFGDDSSRAMFVGALLLNGAAAVTIVAVVARRSGPVPAWWAAVVVVGYLLVLGPGGLSSPWNPQTIVLPTALVIVLAAAGASGSLPSLLGAGVVASCIVQTHIGPAGALLAVLVVATVLWSVAPRPGAPAGAARRIGAALCGLAVLGVVWLPTVVEEVSREPGNLTRLIEFTLDDDHTDNYSFGVEGHPIGDTAAAVATQVAAVPLGMHGGPATSLPGDRLAMALLCTAVGAVVVVVGRRRVARFPAAMAGLGMVAGGAAAWSTTQVVGPLEPYQLVWASALAVPVWLAAGILVVYLLPSGTARRAGPVVLAGASALAVTMAMALVADDGEPTPSHPVVAEAARGAEEHARSSGARTVVVRIPANDRWPVAAGVVLELRRAGFDARIEGDWGHLFGRQLRSDGDEDLVLVVGDAGVLTRVGPVTPRG